MRKNRNPKKMSGTFWKMSIDSESCAAAAQRFFKSIESKVGKVFPASTVSACQSTNGSVIAEEDAGAILLDSRGLGSLGWLFVGTCRASHSPWNIKYYHFVEQSKREHRESQRLLRGIHCHFHLPSDLLYRKIFDFERNQSEG
jgi:hypothetical protein